MDFMIATVKGRRKRNFDQPTGLNFELIFLEISDILFSFRYVLINFSLKQLLSSITNTSDVILSTLFVVVVGIPKKSRGVQKMEIG